MEFGYTAQMEALIAAHEVYEAALTSCRAQAPGWFRSVRANLGLNQSGMAERLDVTNVWISRVETGVEAPGYRMLARLFRLVRDEVDARMERAGMGGES